eukprot:765759-Hanusia_phi.AAC.4
MRAGLEHPVRERKIYVHGAGEGNQPENAERRRNARARKHPCPCTCSCQAPAARQRSAGTCPSPSRPFDLDRLHVLPACGEQRDCEHERLEEQAVIAVHLPGSKTHDTLLLFQSIGSLAWSFACFNIQNKKLFARLEKDLLKMNLQLFTTQVKQRCPACLTLTSFQSISNILWAFATVGFPSDTLLLKFQIELESCHGCVHVTTCAGTPPRVVHTTQSYSEEEIYFRGGSVFVEPAYFNIQRAGRQSFAPLKLMGLPQGIGNILWAVATIGTSIEKFKRLFEVCEEEVLLPFPRPHLILTHRSSGEDGRHSMSKGFQSYTSTGFARDQFVSSVEQVRESWLCGEQAEKLTQEIISRGLKSFNNHTLCILTRSFTLFASFQKSSKASKTDDLDLRDSDEIRKLYRLAPIAKITFLGRISEQELEEIEEVEVEVQVIGKKFFQQLVEILRSCDSDSNKR